MSYAAFDPTVREVELNEYLNITTGEPEVVRYYGDYRVKETFLTSDGKILLLAHDPHGVQKFAVGVYNASLGVYWDNGLDARRNFAWRIAESFGLTVDVAGPKAVVLASREYATELSEKVKTLARELETGCQNEEETEQTAESLAAAAVSLVKHLQRIGVLTEDVYARWDVLG